MMLRRLAAVASLLVGLIAGVGLAAPSYACACGAAVVPRDARAQMNGEVALVHWDGATETVVMQLTMDASTANVALVVPTPAPATVATADKATFTELGQLTAPQVRHQRKWSLDLPLLAAEPQDGAKAAAPGAPTVVNQVHLGPLEATTLAGGDATGLRKWLSDNGYVIKPAVSQALDPYVRDGWAFVALRLTSTTPIVGGLDPVRITFGSSQLVYPMRLSVAAPSPQQVTVFTLSDHRQQRTDADKSWQTTEVQFAGNVAGAVRDPLLRELAGNHGGYLTKLHVDIRETGRITSDFAFGKAPNDDAYRQTITVYDTAVVPFPMVWLGAVMLITVVGLVVVLLGRPRRRTR